MVDTASATGRPLPALTAVNRPYWTSGADGTWRLQQCPDCTRLIHPPTMRCQFDHAIPQWVTLSGRGSVESWTVNQHPFYPGIPTPYVIAFVTPAEDDRVRVLTNLVDVEPDEVYCGMPVRVTFETVGSADDDDEPVYVPLFTPER